MNGDFEEENICTEYGKNCAPEGWFTTSLVSGHYFDDAPNAFEGSHFIGVVVKNKWVSGARNYIRSKLLCGLRKGAQYKLELYVRAFHDVLDSTAIYFSSDDLLFTRAGLNNIQPQLWIKDGGLRSKGNASMEWEKVSFTYTATGNESFIVIGNFAKNNKANLGEPDLGTDYYFFVDAVSFVPLDKNEKLCSEADSIKTSEYEINERHQLLDRKIYIYSKNPPPVEILPKTILQRIDTLIIPDVLFATNSFALNKNANKVLDSFVNKTAGLKVDSLIIEGHTDSTGSIALNQKLSQNRALSVASYLQSSFQPAIITRGLASEKPIADNRTSAGRQKNRRVEIYLYVRE